MEAFAPIAGLKVVFSGKWNCHFQLHGLSVSQITPLAKLLAMLDKNFYANDYYHELVANEERIISFNLYTDSTEVAEYVNRVFVPA